MNYKFHIKKIINTSQFVNLKLLKKYVKNNLNLYL